ncbi:baseplate megatron protein TIM-barrel domain-containing protein [Yoonia sp. 2307UL14-13]|uniref:baseplate megatron protein TIM-barrel domain-containing protein n=1 Tax=Yoonia sp. 2307UL14-13 TaxID=3126506 RepID=UPI00309610BD
MDSNDAAGLRYLFDYWALDHQVPPRCDWRSWVILGGRGAGKTRAGAEWVRQMVEGPTPRAPGLARRVALVGETLDQAREVMVFGDSGLLAVCPPDRRPDWLPSRRLLRWPNGATAQLFSAHEPEALRGPQFDAAWADEFGCAALDKGANQPNKFLDPKSSESQLPYFSTGNRDDFMQMQYLRAVTSHYADEENNPVSNVYGGAMVATDRMHVWAWDTRPYPFFPGNQDLWADGENYGRGHWLNGRATNQSLASVVAEICERSGVKRYDVSRLYGVVRGYSVPQSGSARAALQPLMLTFGFDAIERDGTLFFENRGGRTVHSLDRNIIAVDPENDRELSLTRAPAAEVAGRVQLGYISADDDYEMVASEAVHPDDVNLGVNRSEVSLAMTRNEGRQVVLRWIAEARIARDVANFALPPSQQQIAAGDVIALDTTDHDGIYRIDRVEEDGLRLIEATRIEPQIYTQQTTCEEPGVVQRYIGPVPAEVLFLDLPILTGDETPTAPYVAASGQPWPGSIAIHSSPQDAGYTLQKVIRDPATMGLTHTPLLRGSSGIWDRQEGFEVTLVSGALSSATVATVLAGGNVFAIGDGSADLWEVVQFTHATPIAADRYRLSGLLRGQAGSRGVIPDIWPIGSRVVMLDGVPDQMDLPSAARGNLRHFRYGPAKSPISAPSYRHVSHAFQGNGLRPYPVAHLRAKSVEGGICFSWIRCSRIDGDIWADDDTPLGEETERYTVRVVQNGEVRRDIRVDNPAWIYGDDEISREVGASPYAVEVAQVSARFGAGSFTRIVLGA